MKAGAIAAVSVLLMLLPAASLGAGKARIKHLKSITRDSQTGDFSLLGGIFFDESKQKLYITDTTNGRILAFDADLNFVSAFNAGGALKSPTAMVRNSKGLFFLVEPTKGGIVEVDIAQRSVEPLDFSGVSDAGAIYPGNMAVDSDDNLYIVDKANQRILIFDSALRLDRELAVAEGRGLRDVRVGPDGRIYALNTLDRSVCVYDSQGKLVLKFGKEGDGKGEFGFPTSLAVGKDKAVYVVDQHRHKILAFSSQGEFLFEFAEQGWREGRLRYPSYIFINKAGKIFVLDRDNQRISVFE